MKYFNHIVGNSLGPLRALPRVQASVGGCRDNKFEDGKVIKALKYVAAAAVATLAPMSASALTYFSAYGDGDTYNFSDGYQSLVGVALAPEGAGTITLNIVNDIGANLRFAFDLVAETLSGVTYTFAGAPVTPDFGAPVAGSTQLVINYTGANVGDQIAFAMSAVPVPAAAALMLTAMGALALVRRNKQA